MSILLCGLGGGMMERLTEKVFGFVQLKDCGNDFCKETCAEHDEEKSCKNCHIQKAFEKLAEYEDFEEIFREKMTDTACEFLKDKQEFGKYLDRNKWITKKCDELARAEEQGMLLRLPCNVGDTVYAICNCEAVDTVLDGTLYGSNGGFGTATGYYCPYELSDKCPHIDADDCDECKNIEAVFEDTIDYINITEYETIIGLHNTNLCVTIDEIGKTVFFTQEEAEQKLKEMESD